MKNLFAGLFGKKEPKPAAPGGDGAGQLRRYLEENLPESYVKSKQYAVDITERTGTYTAHIVLDMLADGKVKFPGMVTSIISLDECGEKGLGLKDRSKELKILIRPDK